MVNNPTRRIPREPIDPDVIRRVIDRAKGLTRERANSVPQHSKKVRDTLGMSMNPDRMVSYDGPLPQYNQAPQGEAELSKSWIKPLVNYNNQPGGRPFMPGKVQGQVQYNHGDAEEFGTGGLGVMRRNIMKAFNSGNTAVLARIFKDLNVQENERALADDYLHLLRQGNQNPSPGLGNIYGGFPQPDAAPGAPRPDAAFGRPIPGNILGQAGQGYMGNMNSNQRRLQNSVAGLGTQRSLRY